MCDFFSFVTIKGVPKYIGAAARRRKYNVNTGNGQDPDSHAIICDHFGIKYDACNAYEYLPDAEYSTGKPSWRLHTDIANDPEHDNQDQAERWARKFVQSAEFQEILLLEASRNDTSVIKYLDRSRLTNRLVYRVLADDPSDIRYFKNPKVEWMMYALKINPSVLDDCEFAYGRQLPVAVQMYVIKRWPHKIRSLKHPCVAAKKWAKGHTSDDTTPY